jgi:PPOX class probable FMN-dependent enzyme
MFRQVLTSEGELRELVGVPSEIAAKKQLAALDAHCRAFIGHSPFLLLATADASGRCDVSPKGDAAGFVLVLDDTHLVIPDRPGNRRLDGLRNLLQNPHVGLIFLIPGKEETLRVNGRAWIVRDEELLDRMTVMGKRPQLAIGVEVEECFLHCAKAFKRSKLWQAEHWPERSRLASMAQMLLDHTQPAGMTLNQMEQRLQDGYTKHLY